MINGWDWLVIGIYLGFMLAVGVVCKRLNKNSSDYFRGGGQMLWWMSGMSMCISSISLWTFSAAGIRVYETGFYQVAAYAVALAGIPFLYYIFAQRFRRMRVITSADAIRRRYGRATEQVWVWLTVPINIFYSGVGLHIIAIFVGAALGISIYTTVIILGLVITFMAILGGAWAVAASDFLQGLVTVMIAIIVCIRTFMLPEVGGVSGFFEQLPAEFTNFNLWSRPIIWMPWLCTMAIIGTFRVMNIDDLGVYFLKVKDDRHARWQVILYTFTPLLPLIVFLPIMASKWVVPEMDTLFPNLNRPEEGAYIAIAMKVLPQGMIGMLICAVFAAQMSTLDTGLNKSAGFFTCNFYRDMLRRNASEREMVWIGMLFTFVFGMFIIGIALAITNYRELNIFEFTLMLAPILQVPLVIPMVMGVIMRRTPGWAAWSSALVGIGTGLMVNLVWLTGPERIIAFADLLGLDTPLTDIEKGDFRFLAAWVAVMSMGFGWYFITRLFWFTTTDRFRANVDSFFADMHVPIGDHDDDITPVDDALLNKPHEPGDTETIVHIDRDRDQYSIIGWLTVAYACAVSLGALIPNQWPDRLLFLASGAALGLIGGFLLWQRRRRPVTRS